MKHPWLTIVGGCVLGGICVLVYLRLEDAAGERPALHLLRMGLMLLGGLAGGVAWYVFLRLVLGRGMHDRPRDRRIARVLCAGICLGLLVEILRRM
ncbi:MAG: hypothetical protein D6766_13795 [Verrucomicrobia bacterium]|nr:MAG: hypothetical protein D6766_13795 [Verrucomicrobiota bacterium]